MPAGAEVDQSVLEGDLCPTSLKPGDCFTYEDDTPYFVVALTEITNPASMSAAVFTHKITILHGDGIFSFDVNSETGWNVKLLVRGEPDT